MKLDVVDHCHGDHCVLPCVDDVVYDVVIGNREWMKRSGLRVAADVDRTMKKLEVTGQTVVLCAVNGESLSPVCQSVTCSHD